MFVDVELGESLRPIVTFWTDSFLEKHHLRSVYIAIESRQTVMSVHRFHSLLLLLLVEFKIL